MFTPTVSMKITLHFVVDGMTRLVRHCKRPGVLNTFTASASTIALSQTSCYLATVCQRACLPPVLLSPPKQKGWLITASCCLPIKYYYSCFVYKKRTGEKLWSVPGNVRGFSTSVKDVCPSLSVLLSLNKSEATRKWRSWDLYWKE